MRYPARLSHLATRAVLAAKLMPTYASAHQLDEELAQERLQAALQGPLLEDILASTWAGLQEKSRGREEAEVLESVAATLGSRPLRRGRRAELSPGWSAFLLLADVQAGTASEAARRVLETAEGKKQAAQGLAEVGRYLAKELTRGK